MGQLFRLIVIFAALWLLAQLVRRALHLDRSSRSRPTKPTTLPRMLPCAYCGVHIPENEAISHAGKIYCCREHRALAEVRH